MADINLSSPKDTIHVNESVGQNPVFNGDFESAPSFTAATTVSSRWIDGTASGSTTLDTWGWEIQTATGTVSAQFDSSTSNSGTNSLKISTLATGSRIDTGEIINASTVSNVFKYGIPVLPSTAYKITFAMKTTLNSGASASGATLRVSEFTTAGASSTNTNSTVVNTTTNWTNYTVNVTTGSTTAYIHLVPQIIGNTGAATLVLDAWFDTFNIQPTSMLTGVDIPLGPLVTPGVQSVSGPKIWS